MVKIRGLVLATMFLGMGASAARAQTAVLTRSYNTGRTGANTHETKLTPATVAGIKLLRTISLDAGDDPRLEAQPLYVPALAITPGHPTDVVIVATMANNVYAFDVNTGAKVWKTTLGNPIEPAFKGVTPFGLRETEIDLYGTNVRWGILSTPVIDADTRTLYVVSWSSATGKILNAEYRLHALNLATGAPRKPSIAVDGSSGGVSFLPNGQKQRAALLLVKVPRAGGAARKTLIVASGLVRETGAGQGWVIAFDVDSFRRTAAWASTPGKQGGGIWQANQGPAADDHGFIYFMTGNGAWNGTTAFSETFMKLRYTPPTTPTGNGSLTVADWFTPFIDADRGPDDQDLGSGGAVLALSGLVVGGGKDGVLYVLNRANMGHRHKPKAAIFFTYFPGFGPNPLDVHALDGLAAPATRHLHGSPIAWGSAAHGRMLFVWGENSPLRAWTLQPDGRVQFLAESLETASAFSTHQDAMPGGMLTLSANGNTNGVVWGSVPIKSHWEGRDTEADANKEIVEGVLRAYHATTFGPKAPNGNATLTLLWQSTTPGTPGPMASRFTYNKFCPPVVADGKILVATYDGRVLVFGL
jgi:outer membrane protein assembly factor BamB